MPVSFILRSPYLPSNRSCLRLDAPSPLAWFQSVWPRLLGDEAVSSRDLLGADDLYGFAGFAQQIRDKRLPAPASNGDLEKMLSRYWYLGNVECRDGYVLVETDDDEVELAFWWVSGEVLAEEQERFACYQTDTLPGGTGDGRFDPSCEIESAGEAAGEGTTYCSFVTVWDSGNLSDLPGPVRIDGLRLPDFAGWLSRMPADENRLFELEWLALVARSHPSLDLPALLLRTAEVSAETASSHYQAIRARTISEEELREDIRWLGSRERAATVQNDAHILEFRFDDGFNYHICFLFDDLWASAHPVLARSLLHFSMPIA